MKVISRTDPLREWNRANRHRRRVLVPTMGALHQGHLSLCDFARENAGPGGDVVVTVFVNPTQFGPGEDWDAYPRPLEQDIEKCRAQGVDLVFTPEPHALYADDASTVVDETRLSRNLCGASRTGHFRGVCTIVTKLFHLTSPDAAVFGEKDFQQLAIIRRLVRDLDFPIEILAGPTVRESDGLAMSSRNAYLNREERAQAPVIYQTLSSAISGIKKGTLTNPADVIRFTRTGIESASLASIDYIELVDPDTLEPLTKPISEQQRPCLAVAVCFGKTRLIDHVTIG